MVINSPREKKRNVLFRGHRIRVDCNYINRGVHTVRVRISVSVSVRVRARVRVKCPLEKCCTPYIYIYGAHVIGSESKRLLTHTMV